MTVLMQCFLSFLGCLGFCIVVNIRGKLLFLAPLCGALAWFSYSALGFLKNDIFQYFLATIIISIYSEIMARINKNPATGYLMVGLLPLVPGGGLYYTMRYGIEGDMSNFLNKGLNTLGIAGSLAVGILLVLSAVRLWKVVFLSRKEHNVK